MGLVSYLRQAVHRQPYEAVVRHLPLLHVRRRGERLMRIETIGEPGQGALFDDGPAWAERWKGMPSYEHDDLEPWRSVKVHFRNRDDMKAFG